jgi:hypothetical protein
VAGPVQWASPDAAPVNRPTWAPPDDAVAGFESDVDEFGRAVSPAAPTGPRRAPQISGGQAMDMLDAELEANLAAADAELEAQGQRGPGGPGDVIAGQMQGLYDSEGLARQQYLANQPKHGSRANPVAPFVQRRLAEQQGGNALAFDFQPQPYEPIPRFEGDTDEEYAARNDLFEQIHQREEQDRYDRQYAEAVGQAGTLTPDTDMGQIGQVLGFEDAQRQGAGREHAAMTEQATELAREEAIAAQKQADATNEAAAAMDRQREHERQAQAAVTHLRGVRDQARKDLAALPQINRERIAKGLSTGTKLAAVFGAIAQGWRGDAITAVNDAIDRGVAEEMDRYSRKQAEYGDTVAQADDAMGFLDFSVNSLGGNVRAGESMLRTAKIEDAIAELKAREAAATVPVMREQLMNVRVGLEQRLRDETDAMELEAITTPERLGFTIDTPAMKLERELAKTAITEGRKEQRDLRKDFRGEVSKEADRAGAMELEGVKSQGAVAAKRAEKDAEWDNKIKEQTRLWNAAEKQIDDILSNTGNIHGVGMIGTGSKDERITTDSQRRGLKLSLTSAWTGASASPEQQEEFEALVEGDWTEISDDDFRARLRALKNIVSAQRRGMQNPLGSAEKNITNPRELSTFEPR